MTRIDRIKEILIRALKNPTGDPTLVITDDTAKHAHHRHNPGGEETHLTIAVTSERFVTMNRITRHRHIYALLAPEFDTGLHAVKLILHTPAEKQR